MLEGHIKQKFRLNEAQFGFRPHFSTGMAILTVQRLYRKGHKRVLILYLKATYDLVPRDRIRARLKAKVTSGSLQLLLKC